MALDHNCVQVEGDCYDLHAALYDLLDSITSNVAGIREGSPLAHSRRRAMAVLERTSRPPCPACGHPSHVSEWCMATVDHECEDCGAPRERCRCAVG